MGWSPWDSAEVSSQAVQPDPVEAPALSGPVGRSMPSDLASTLRSQIHAGLLGPGDRLPNQRELATAWGVGRITVREALRILSDEGYIVSKRGNSGGTYVSDLAVPHQTWIERARRDKTWVVDLIEYRKAIEMRACELAAERRTTKQLTQMRRAITEGANPPSRRVFRQADHRFHLTVAEASGSERLTSAIKQARGELFVPTDQLDFRDHYAQTESEHTRIATAIAEQDPDAARDAAEAHLTGTLQDFLDMIL